MKKKIKITKEDIIKTTATLIITFIAALFLLLALWNKLLSYDVCCDIKYFWYFLLISIGLAIVVSITYLIIKKKIKTENRLKLNVFFRKSYPFFLDGLYIIVFLLFAINGKLFLKYERAKDLLTIDWMIFAISVAIFLVWGKTVFDYLEKIKPEEIKNTDNPIDKLSAIQQNASFSGQTNLFFNSVLLVVINIISLVIATVMLFITKEESIPLFVQNILLFALIVTTNTIISLLFDLVRVLLIKKIALMDGAQISLKETGKVYDELYIKVVIGAVLKTIDEDTNKTAEEKEELKNDFIKYLIKNVASDNSAKDEEQNAIKDE